MEAKQLNNEGSAPMLWPSPLATHAEDLRSKHVTSRVMSLEGFIARPRPVDPTG